MEETEECFCSIYLKMVSRPQCNTCLQRTCLENMCDSLDYHFVVCLLGPCAFASLYRYKMAIFPDLVIIALGSVVNLFIFITSYYAGFRFLGLIYMTTLVH